MVYQIIIARSAVKEYEKLDPSSRSEAKKAMIRYLQSEPKRIRKTRVKRLVGLRRPQYRLRVGDLRIYYDVNDKQKRVEILGFVPKAQTERWLKARGVSQ
jgi:mRNA interferase RelE/StbE